MNLLFLLFIGLEKIAQILIENGAMVNAVNQDKNSALNIAALKGYISNYMYIVIKYFFFSERN